MCKSAGVSNFCFSPMYESLPLVKGIYARKAAQGMQSGHWSGFVETCVKM